MPMPGSRYHEELWRSLPQDVRPPGLERRARFVLRHVSDGLRVLDVGCGDGAITERIAAAGASVVGIDVAPEAVRRAQLRDPLLDVRVVEPDGPWELADSSFDLVWAGDVIEHVLDTAAWMSEVRRVMRSGGVLALSTPDHGPLTRLSMALSGRRFAARINPLSDHVRFYSRATLSGLLEQFGMESVRVAAAGGLPLARDSLMATAIRSRY